MSVLACNNSSKKQPEKAQEKTAEQDNSPITCYQYADANDTIVLKLINIGKAVTGTLEYKLKEKDKNRGTIQGRMQGDMLMVKYTFMSEGVMSAREVVFKKENGVFIEGFGEVINNHDLVTFKDHNALTFNEKMKLSAINCR